MAAHPVAEVDKHLRKCGVASADVTISATNTATLGAGVNLSTQQLHELIDGSHQQKFDVKVVSGAVVIYARQ